MSRTRASIAVGIGTVALLVSGPMPASAATSGETTTTFTLEAGTIDVTVQGSAALTNGSSGQLTVSGQLGVVNVTDNRGGTVGWITSAASTAFSNGSGSSSTGVSYNSGSVSKTGTVTVVSAGPTTLSANPSPVVTGTLVVGNNTASWNPTLTVSLPSNSLAGNYSGVVTTSVT